MIRSIYIVLFTAALCLWTSCSKEKEETSSLEFNFSLETNPQVLFDSYANEAVISFYSNATWTASVPHEVSDWCQLSQTSGEPGHISLLVAVSENVTSDDRNAKITIRSGDASAIIFVIQKQKDALTATTNRFEVEQSGGIIAIEVKSNIPYNWEMSMGTVDWVTPIKGGEDTTKDILQSSVFTRALETETLYFRIDPNEETDIRTGMIVFYATGSNGLFLEETVTIYQHAKSAVLLTNRQQNFSDAGGWVEAEISSNTDYEVKLPAVDWIQRNVSTRAMSTHTLYFKVLPNETYDARQAEIIFCKKGDATVADTLHVTQAQKDGIILGTKEIKVSEKGAIVEVQVKANIETKLDIDNRYDWLEALSSPQLHTRALTEGKLYLKVAANPTYNAREAWLLLRGVENVFLQEKLKIVQGQQRKLTIEKSSLEIEPEGGKIDFPFTTSVDYSVRITANWLRQPSYTRALIGGRVYLEIDPYTEFNQPERSALVILKDKDSELADTMTIVQKPRLKRTYHVATAGTLPTLVPEDEKFHIRSLTLTGKLNGTDIYYIREMAGRKENDKRTEGKLIELDISATEITGGGEPYYSRWGSGAMQPNPTTHWYTYDRGKHAESIRPVTACIYTEGIGPHMFKYCHLQKLTLPQQVRLIGEEAFRGCEFSTLTLPETVATIDKKAFYYCNLTTLHLQSTVPPTLDEDVFVGVESLVIYVPLLSMHLYKTDERWNKLNIVSE